MRVAVFDDIDHAWEGSDGVRRLRERAEAQVVTRRSAIPPRCAAAMRCLPTASLAELVAKRIALGTLGARRAGTL